MYLKLDGADDEPRYDLSASTREPPPPPRLHGLSPGEFEVSDGRVSVSTAYGEDGRQFETTRGGAAEGLSSFAKAISGKKTNAVEILADYVASLDPGEAGPGK